MHIIANGPRDGAAALAEEARNAPTTSEEALARSRAAQQSNTIRAKEGETIDEAQYRHAREEYLRKEAIQHTQIEKQTELSVSAGEANRAFQSETTRYYAVPPVENMIIKIGGTTEISVPAARTLVQQGSLSEAEVLKAIEAEGRFYDPQYQVPRNALGFR